MTVERLDHVNITSVNLAESARFYTAALGLKRCDPPPPLKPEQAQWMQNDQGISVIHLNSVDCPRAFDRPMPKGHTGPIHHVALACTGYGETLARIDGLGIEREVNNIPSIGLKQVFLHDPNGVLLELNFFEG